MQTSLAAFWISLCVGGSLHAQVSQAWSQDYNAPANQADWGYRANSDSQGNVVVTGRSFLPSVGFPPPPPVDNMFVAKYSPTGSLLWAQHFSYIGGGDAGRDVLVAADDSIYALSYSSGYVAANYVTDIVLVKYDALGNLLWSQSYDGPGASADIARRMRFDSAGNVLIAGYSYNALGNADGLVLKYDPAGNLLWSTLLPGTAGANDFMFDLAVLWDDSLRVVGQANNGVDPARAIAALSPTGSILWQREFQASAAGSEYLFGVALADNGDAYACGHTQGSGTGQDISVIKLDSAGNLQWQRTINGSANGTDNSFELKLDPAGNALVAGYVRQSTSSEDMLLAKYDAAGTLLWQRTWDSGANLEDQAPCLEVDALGRIALGGWRIAASGSPTNRDYALVMYDSDGSLRSANITSSPGSDDDRAYDLHQLANGDFVLTGQVHASTQALGDAGTVLFHPQAQGYCFGDGALVNCPCNNQAFETGRGCQNSLGSAAQLTERGIASLSADSLVFTSAGELPTALSIFLQGSSTLANPVHFGDGLRCVGGTLKRLYVKNAVAGVVSAPALGDPSVSAQSAALGDALIPGSKRYVQVYYRDANAGYCAAPAGGNYNISNGLILDWLP